MKHISILALHDATLSSIDTSHQILSRVNDFLLYQGKAAFYQVEIVGLDQNVKLNHGLYTIAVDTTISAVKKTDVIVIPLLCGDFKEILERNARYKEWLTDQYEMGAEIVTLCVGSFFLASTGLLNGKNCAVHWASKSEFEAMFPKVNLISDSIITDEAGIYTSAGGFSYLNLLLYIIEKHLGRELSILTSKMFEIDIDRSSQNPFMIFMGQKRHEDSEVLRAQELIESDPTARVGIDELCMKVCLARRTFERRFKKSTGNSVAEYIQRVKVEYVKKQLECSTDPVNEISFHVGYTNIDAFRKVFRKYTDLTPRDYRKRYNPKQQ